MDTSLVVGGSSGQTNPTKRLVAMADVADATDFLLRNPAVNGHDLALDGGVIIT